MAEFGGLCRTEQQSDRNRASSMHRGAAHPATSEIKVWIELNCADISVHMWSNSSPRAWSCMGGHSIANALVCVLLCLGFRTEKRKEWNYGGKSLFPTQVLRDLYVLLSEKSVWPFRYKETEGSWQVSWRHLFGRWTNFSSQWSPSLSRGFYPSMSLEIVKLWQSGIMAVPVNHILIGYHHS